MNDLSPPIAIHEVAPRDGLQMEPRFVPTADKVAWIDALSDLGYAKIEVTSFVSPAAIPALRDADEVMRRIRRRPGTVYAALVPNVRGAERAIEAGADELNVVLSASATHNIANLRMLQSQSFAQVAQLAKLAREGAGRRVAVNVSLSCAFGCPMEGEVPPGAVLGWLRLFGEAGVDAVTLCDTTGMADPVQVEALCTAARAALPGVPLTAHFHDTRGLGGANVMAALRAGITRFDSALGGIGGCPYAPGASGNLATEDLVHLLQCIGHDCGGLSVEALAAPARQLAGLIDRPLPAAVGRAGPRWQRHPLPVDFHDIHERALARDVSRALV